jgi:hypothetical protein
MENPTRNEPVLGDNAAEPVLDRLPWRRTVDHPAMFRIPLVSGR